MMETELYSDVTNPLYQAKEQWLLSYHRKLWLRDEMKANTGELWLDDGLMERSFLVAAQKELCESQLPLVFATSRLPMMRCGQLPVHSVATTRDP